MFEFIAVDGVAREERALRLKLSLCCFDILPKSFSRVFRCLPVEFLHVVKSSFLSGIFSSLLKTAVMKALLKKESGGKKPGCLHT